MTPRHPRSARLITGLAFIALAGILSSCSSTSSATSSTTSTSLYVRKIQPPAPEVAALTMTINGKTVFVPRQEYSQERPIFATQDQGQQVLITDKGQLPQVLYAPVPATITWTNLTTKPVTLSIQVASAWRPSQVIEPGGHYSLSVTSDLNVETVTSTGWSGSVAVGQIPLPPIPTTTLPKI